MSDAVVLGTAIVANIDGARRLKTLAKYIRLYKPVVVVIEECPRWRTWFANIRGYRIAEVAPFVEGDRRSTLTLRHKSMINEHSWLIRVRRRWFGPHGNAHDGRAMTPMRLSKGTPESRFRLLPAHYPTKRGVNLPAWQEAVEKGEDFLERDGDSPLFILGDVNAGRGVLGPWAEEHGYDQAWFGVVDAAFAKGGRVQLIEKLPAETGHGWGVVKLLAN